MIRLSRPEKPGILADHAQQWLTELQTAPKERAKVIGKRYNHPDVRQALEAMSHKKCSFCESKILHVTAAHIEHFRPKGVPEFAHLIFHWDNLFLACPACNSDHKKTQFPLDDQDAPLLVDPCADEPRNHLVFDTISGRIAGKDEKGKTTVRVLGLNRTDLWERRNSLLEKLLVVANLAKRGHSEALQLLRETADDGEEYSAFTKVLLESITQPDA